MSKAITLLVLFGIGYGFWRLVRKAWRSADIWEQKERVVIKEGQFENVKDFMKEHKVPKSFKERMKKFFE